MMMGTPRWAMLVMISLSSAGIWACWISLFRFSSVIPGNATGRGCSPRERVTKGTQPLCCHLRMLSLVLVREAGLGFPSWIVLPIPTPAQASPSPFFRKM